MMKLPDILANKIGSFFKQRHKIKNTIKAAAYHKVGISNFHSIRVKLIAAFFVMIIPISALGIISQKLASDALEHKAIESSKETMKKTSDYLDLVFEMVQDTYQQLTTNRDIRDYIKSDIIVDSQGNITGDNPYGDYMIMDKAKQILVNTVLASQFLSKIEILRDGQNHVGSSTLALDEKVDDLRQTSWYKDAEANMGFLIWRGDHKEFDEFVSGEYDKAYSMSAIAVLDDMRFMSTNSAASNAIFIADIKFDFVNNLLDGTYLGEGSTIHLISPDGRVISSSAEKEKSEDIADIVNQGFYQDIQNSEKQSNAKLVSYHGKDHLMVYNKIDMNGYVLIGLIPRSELLAAARDIKIWTLGLVILAAIAAMGMGLYMAMRMGKTISHIVDIADSASRGDLTANPVSRSKDELGILTQSMAKMISNMREIIQQVVEIANKVAHSAETVASTSEEISTTSHEVSSAIQEISRGSSEQAGDAEQGSRKMEKLALKINNVSDNTKSIHHVSQNTGKLVQQGLVSIEDLDKKSHETTAITGVILSDIQQLQQQSKSIDMINKVINGIVEQTKLLALNAAIEAARAGKAGRGFAVVADEVRKLAGQSMEATHEITSIIKSIHQQTAQMVERAKSVEETVKSQNQSVVTSISIFKQIAEAMNNLEAAVDGVMSGIAEMEGNKNEAVLIMHNVSSVSQQTAASTEEITASTEEQLSSIEELAVFAQELSDAARQLTRSIEKFKI
ncbi:methyl-accepting chemotaxis protein [Petroclostridium sp. X23]|uniref:methyl-accepting chemotaxis protein n=1 Tax=Petroclostridium sp. X23 TaxID=3045146 RepID=UPI0024AD8A63|nr:methyl-accepting chemotaxis protein [Petroclostridium sp. X23]WHH61209.1 methyl-accepting chemotaxis protein [Petroclostridium sp. X23]